jgi:vacuolar-type H+-ATPase subunit I/STV1
LRSENQKIKAENQKLMKEVATLKETADYHYQQGINKVSLLKYEEATSEFKTVIDMYPKSPLAANAKEQLAKTNKLIVDRRAEVDKVIKQLPRRLANAENATSASAILDETESKYPYLDIKEYVEKQRVELKDKLEKEKQALESLKVLGVELSNVRTYWTINTDVLGDQRLIIPYIRFTVKNTGSSPITKLAASACFDLTDKKEMLREGSACVISRSDHPLKPGYTREVFFGSGTGYKDTGWNRYLEKPTMTADLYLETDQGEKRLVKTIRISKEYIEQ